MWRKTFFPPQIRSLVASALHAKGTRVTEDGISLRKLRWTLGNPRLPAWACSCEHVSYLNGATVSYTGGSLLFIRQTTGRPVTRPGGVAGRPPGGLARPRQPHLPPIPGLSPDRRPDRRRPRRLLTLLPPLLSPCLTLLLPPPLCLRPPSPLRLMGRRRWLSRQLCYRRGRIAGSKCPAPHSRMGSRPQRYPLGLLLPRRKPSNNIIGYSL